MPSSSPIRFPIAAHTLYSRFFHRNVCNRTTDKHLFAPIRGCSALCFVHINKFTRLFYCPESCFPQRLLAPPKVTMVLLVVLRHQHSVNERHPAYLISSIICFIIFASLPSPSKFGNTIQLIAAYKFLWQVKIWINFWPCCIFSIKLSLRRTLVRSYHCSTKVQGITPSVRPKMLIWHKKRGQNL